MQQPAVPAAPSPLPHLERKWSVVIGTVDRTPGPNYLGATLQSLRRSVAHLDVQVVDGGSPDPTGFAKREHVWCNGVTFHPSLRRLTRNENGVRCLEVALARAADYVLFLEDDLEVCHDLLASVDRWIEGRPAAQGPVLYSVYCPFGRASQEGQEGAWRYPRHLFNGCQAFALRSVDASGALDYLRKALPGWGSPGGFDRLLSAWLRHCDGQILASVPSFVQHVGYQTAMGYPHWHQSPTWPGADWSYPRGLDR